VIEGGDLRLSKTKQRQFMKIFLNKKSWEKKDEVEKIVNHNLLYNPDFNGSNFTIEKAQDIECNYIEECDEIAGSFLLNKINDLLEI
jgi:hypothetical protein